MFRFGFVARCSLRATAFAWALSCAACDEDEPSTGGSFDAGETGEDASRPLDGGTTTAGRDAGRPPRSDAGSPPPTVDVPTQPASFPLQVSADHRYLVDQAGQAFLINQASSWGVIQSLSTQDATAWLDGLAERGFNTVMMSVISNDQRMPGSPPAWQGIEPFNAHWDFSDPNPAYFDHADEILELAASRHLLVNLVVCYLGFPGDSTQGWEDELLSGNNSLDKSREYGRFLGDRYKRFDNIVWVAGGDNLPDPGSQLEKHMLAIMAGIRERDPDHLWTAHWSGMDDGMVASDNPAFADAMDLNGYYAFNYDVPYVKDLKAYASQPTKPLFHLDMSYETEDGGSAEAIRARAYRGVLSGAAGSSFNAGPDWYLFKNWRAMDTQGTRETEYWYNFFRSRPWQNLVPDTDHRAVVDGYGSFGSADYVTAARSQTGDLIIAYLPEGGSVTVDLGMMPAARGRAYWYDPTTGVAQRAGDAESFDLAAQADFEAPSRESWVLVVEDAASPLGAPGTPLVAP